MRLGVAIGCCFEGATDVSDGILGWSPDGGTIFTSGPGALGALNATSGKQMWQAPNVSVPHIDHRIILGWAEVETAEANVWYSPDGLHIASNCWYECDGCGDRVSFCFFSTNDGKLTKIVNTSWHRDDGVWPMAMSPDGKQFAGYDYSVPLTPWDTQRRFVRIWDADTGAVVANLKQGGTMLGGGDNIQKVAFSPDGKHLVSIGEDEHADLSGMVQGMISVWDLAKKRRIKLTDTKGTRGMPAQTTISFTQDGAYFATGSRYDDTIRIWDAAARKLVRRISAMGSYRIILSPDGTKIATLYSKWGPTYKLGAKLGNRSFNDPHWYIHDAVTGDCLQDIPIEIPDYLVPDATALWSPDGSYFAWQSTFDSGSLQKPDVQGPIHITAFRSGNCTNPASQRRRRTQTYHVTQNTNISEPTESIIV
jgi:WD40 repeat protein